MISALSLAVTVVHTATFAQQGALAASAPWVAQAEPAPAETAPAEPASAAPAAPPQAPPAPPAYPPPPPYASSGGYGTYPGTYPSGPPRTYGPQAYYPPAPPPSSHYRPVSLTLGIGAGNLGIRYDDEWDSDWGLSYLLRVGFGLTRNFALTLAFEGTSTSRDDLSTSQHALLIGGQLFLARALYVRAGIGSGDVTESLPGYLTTRAGPGMAYNAGLGVELIQAPSTALGVELTGTLVTLHNTTWGSAAANVVLSFY